MGVMDPVEEEREEREAFLNGITKGFRLEEIVRNPQILREKIDAFLKTVRTTVCDNGGTGDPALDFTLMHVGFDFRSYQNLKSISDDFLRNYAEQDYLVLVTYKTNYKVPGGPVYALGILAHPPIMSIDQPIVILPVRSHIRKDAKRPGWTRAEDHIKFSAADLAHYSYTTIIDEDPGPRMNVLFGDDVLKYFRMPNTDTWAGYVDDANNCSCDPSLEQALKMMGVPVPRDFQESAKYFRRRTSQILEDVRQSADKLSHLQDCQKELWAKKYSDRKMTKKITAEIEEIDASSSKVTRSIEGALREALRYSMHEEPREMKLERGITMNVSEYITHLAEKFFVH